MPNRHLRNGCDATLSASVDVPPGQDGSLSAYGRAPKVDLSLDSRPHLFVVVDTEEEFDWNAPYQRSNTHVTAMRHIGRAQQIFDRFGIRPVYVVDYPIAAQPDGYLPLLEILRDGRCDIGAHLHPWVNPPHDEPVSVRNSFMMNLPESLQRAKLEALSDQIARVFGTRPRTFKAGRYGISPSTIGILDQLGFEVDVSVCPQFDFSASEGPSFMAFDSRPFFLTDRLLEIPCTADYTGWAGLLRPALHRIASRDTLASFRGVGVLAKIGAVNRIMLSPEGNTFAEMRALTETLYERGQRTFLLSFHSPSVEPGHSPYVRTRADLDQFLLAIENFCEFFMEQRNGVAAVPRDFRAAVSARVESH